MIHIFKSSNVNIIVHIGYIVNTWNLFLQINLFLLE